MRGVVEQQSGVAIDPERTDIFLCGNPDMIRDAKSLLEPRGFVPDKGRQSGTLHVEEYW